MRSKLSKREWVKADGYHYLVSMHSKVIWAKISGWREGFPDSYIQHVVIHAISNESRHIIAKCGGFELEEAQELAETLAINPFPEKLSTKRGGKR